MTTRRGFLAGLAATTLPAPSWADAGAPAWLAAAREADGTFALFGMTAAAEQRFRVPLPARAHAGAAHPSRPEAVVFARRPGTFALVVDCLTGEVRHRLDAPAGRHFYGHGAFLADGDTLWTTENEIETGKGRIGIWSRSEGYRRVGAFASGGIGPHEMLRLPGSDTVVVANGGIRTHPDKGREKLNLDTMRPNLSYFGADGAPLDRVELDPALRLNSIRHLAARADGLVAFAMQRQGEDGVATPLLGLHRQGAAPILAEAPLAEQRALDGYAGSVSFDGRQRRIAISSPRGGRVHLFDAKGGFLAAHRRRDVCGLAPADTGLVATDGLGGVLSVGEEVTPLASFPRAWDNHMIPVGG